MADRSIKGFTQNFAGAPAVRAEGTAENLQSFDEITIMSEQPAKADPWIPRGKPRKGLSGDESAARSAANTEGRFVAGHDDTTNIRGDNEILTRATPASSKVEKRARPNYLRTYTDAAGEGL